MDLSTKLYRIYRTCLQMLRDRDYLISQDKLNETLEDFQKEFGEGESVRREELTIFVPKVEDPQDQVRAACWRGCARSGDPRCELDNPGLSGRRSPLSGRSLRHVALARPGGL